jgi:UPF0716 protein FxsA
LVALAEITTLILLGQLIGAAATLLVLLTFSLSGVILLRHAARRLLRPFAQGRNPSEPVTAPMSASSRETTESIALLGAGLLLTVPGILTGLAGTLLLIPPVRKLLQPLALRMAGPVHTRLQRATGPGPVIQGEVITDKDEPPSSP